MKKTVLISVLALLAAAVLLYTVSMGVSGIWAANRQDEHIRMMTTLLPGCTSFTKERYAGEDSNIRSVHRAENGYVIETAVPGYAGEITMLIGVSNEGAVTGLVVRSLTETHSLGRRILTDADYLAQYLNTTGDAEVGVNVDALTGATVTSKAVTRSVNSAVAYVTGVDTVSEATEWGGS